MPDMRSVFGSHRIVAGLILAGALATIGGALIFEYGFGYIPCKLCLTQRIPYYAAMPVALVAMLLAPGKVARAALTFLALIFLVSAGLGAYHSGVEWHWWLGPADCGGANPTSPANVGDFMQSLNRVRVVSCTEAAWRFLGISLAGWNVLISLGLAGLALIGLKTMPRA